MFDLAAPGIRKTRVEAPTIRPPNPAGRIAKQANTTHSRRYPAHAGKTIRVGARLKMPMRQIWLHPLMSMHLENCGYVRVPPVRKDEGKTARRKTSLGVVTGILQNV